MRDALARIDGVGDVNLFGLREYSMRVWLDPERLAARSLTTSDVVAALREQNVQVASGVIGQPPVPAGDAFQLPVTTLGRLLDAGAVRATSSSRPARTAASRACATSPASSSARATTRSTATSTTSRPWRWRSSSGPARTRWPPPRRSQATMNELSTELPRRARVSRSSTTRPSSSASRSTRCIHTLFEAVVLVVLVVLLFLQTWRASLIPLLAIPVSLIGTFAAMAAFGFSLNKLSLFGLVLAIGIVVDDAIVVVENVERHIAAGPARRARPRSKAMDEVTPAVIAIAFGLSRGVRADRVPQRHHRPVLPPVRAHDRRRRRCSRRSTR